MALSFVAVVVPLIPLSGTLQMESYSPMQPPRRQLHAVRQAAVHQGSQPWEKYQPGFLPASPYQSSRTFPSLEMVVEIFGTWLGDCERPTLVLRSFSQESRRWVSL